MYHIMPEVLPSPETVGDVLAFAEEARNAQVGIRATALGPSRTRLEGQDNLLAT